MRPIPAGRGFNSNLFDKLNGNSRTRTNKTLCMTKGEENVNQASKKEPIDRELISRAKTLLNELSSSNGKAIKGEGRNDGLQAQIILSDAINQYEAGQMNKETFESWMKYAETEKNRTNFSNP